MVLLVLVGCQPKPEPVVAPAPKDSSAILGTYRLKATPDETAETSGLESLPTLVIKADHFRILIDNKEESSGIWKYENGILILSDKQTGENTKFKADSTGTELTEESEDPLIFQKYGVDPAATKSE